jgi:NAD(P)-dependent dehydrogenase (short-subunit alcohol dehydrogenase family)
VLHGRDEAALASVHARISDLGGQVISVTGDVTVAADLARMRDRILDEYGHPDVLVANEGGSDSRPTPIEDITEEGWRADIDRNLTSTFLTVKCFLPGMKQRRSGSIITLSWRRAANPTGTHQVGHPAGVAVPDGDGGGVGVAVEAVAEEATGSSGSQAGAGGRGLGLRVSEPHGQARRPLCAVPHRQAVTRPTGIPSVSVMS